MSTRSIRSKVFSRTSLAKKLKSSKFKKKKIVFTNGCFDLLHPGHVFYLERARKLGDLLVVALNSDESVRRLGKGSDRPVQALKNRMEVMASLEAVDFVCSFDEDTPLKTILLLKPKWIVKGGDWTPDKIVGGKEAKEWKGKAKSLPYLEGHSTTFLIQKMRS